MISIKLHSNFVGIALPHACFPVSLSRAPFCGNTSGRLRLNAALVMNLFFCEIANQVQYNCDQEFESSWMSVELNCSVKLIIVFRSFTTSFVDGIL